jgi:hypothetical protein
MVLHPSPIRKELMTMLEQEHVKDLALDLEQRIDKIQNLGDEELGTFTRLDWLILIVIAIVLPVVAMIAAR